MPIDTAAQVTQYLLAQGPLGVVCGFLLWYALRQERKIEDLRDAHKVEIAAERKLNAELQETRLSETKVVLDALTTTRQAVEVLSASIKNSRNSRAAQQ